jgi:lipoprotein-releasing system permease protein
LNLELNLAKRIVFGNEGTSASRPVIKIALFSVALGLAVMLIALVMVEGFQNEITKKVTGFGGHIILGNFTSNQSYELEPLDKSKVDLQRIKKVPHITHVQEFATKASIIKTQDEIQGVVLKGVGADFNWSYIKNNLIAGNVPAYTDGNKSDAILMSEALVKMLKLKLNQKVFFYFIEGNQQLIRKFTIAGIYNTGFEEIDNQFVLCDIAHIRKLNNWQPNQTGSYEILIDDFKHLDTTADLVYSATGSSINVRTIKDDYPQIFSWLILIDTNVYIIIGLMLIVASINMISTLLIIILENTSEIGILKALGATNRQIRKVFFYVSVYLMIGGIALGNFLGLGLATLQYIFHFITLEQDTYYIAYAPVAFSLTKIALLNFGTMLICILVLLLPALVISKIQPIKAIRFE